MRVLVIAVTLFLLILPTVAREDSSSGSSRGKGKRGGGESWYINLGYGSSKDKIPGEIQEQFDTEIEAGAEDISMAIDLGLYWPTARKATLFGFSMNGGAYTLSGSSTLTLYTYLYALSLMHFFSSAAGKGLYIRGDYGLTRRAFGSKDSLTMGGSGTGYLVEAGLGIPITKEARFLLGYYYSDKIISRLHYISHGFKLSILF